MPELPEVETVRRGLAAGVTGRRIARVAGAAPPARPPPPRRPRRLRRRRWPGGRSPSPRAAGKYLWLPLRRRRRPAGPPRDERAVPARRRRRAAGAQHPGARSTFADGDPQLRFVDQRMFGGLSLSPGRRRAARRGRPHRPRPLRPRTSTSAAAAGRIRAKRTGDQAGAARPDSWSPGIGNIYADEALWLARTALRPGDRRPRAGQARSRCCTGGDRGDGRRRWSRAGPPSTRCTSTSTAPAATSTARWRSTARRAGRAPAAAPPIRREPFMNRSVLPLPALPAHAVRRRSYARLSAAPADARAARPAG